MNTQADHGMEPHASPQEVSDRELLLRLSVLEARLCEAGQGLRANLVFQARQRIMQLASLRELTP